MALTVEQRREVWRALADELVRDGPVSLTKAELDAAATAVDAWIDANQVSFNTALPQPFRSQATALQKSVLFSLVLARRVRG
jgi:hypothetical protein